MDLVDVPRGLGDGQAVAPGDGAVNGCLPEADCGKERVPTALYLTLHVVGPEIPE